MRHQRLNASTSVFKRHLISEVISLIESLSLNIIFIFSIILQLHYLNLSCSPKVKDVKKPKSKKRKSQSKVYINTSSSNLHFKTNSLIDLDYTYKMVKELENIRTSKNAELRDKIFNPDLNSTSNILVSSTFKIKIII